MFSKPMKLINTEFNQCKTAVAYEERSRVTQLSLFDDKPLYTSHNIYCINSGRKPGKLGKPAKSVRLNKVGSTDILSIQINKIKSILKDELGTFVTVLGVSQPIPVRESLSEINNLINKENNYGR